MDLAIIEKGVDKQIECYDPDGSDLKGTSILLNSYYRKKIETISAAMSKDMGVKIPKTSLLAKAAKQYIDEQYSELNLPDLPTINASEKQVSNVRPMKLAVDNDLYYEFQRLAATEKLEPGKFLEKLIASYKN